MASRLAGSNIPDLLVIGARFGRDVRMGFALLPHPNAPELGLNIGVCLQGDFHRGAGT